MGSFSVDNWQEIVFLLGMWFLASSLVVQIVQIIGLIQLI